MLRLTTILAAVLALVALPGAATAAPCKDAKGKFIKCPPPAPAKGARCKDARGKFAKCDAPGAKPV